MLRRVPFHVLMLSLALALAPAATHAVTIDFTAIGFVDFFDEDTGDDLGTVILGLDGSINIDAGATETSPNNFIGAATVPTAFIEVLSVEGMPGVDLGAFPYFTDFPGTSSEGTPNDVGDVFVGAFEQLSAGFATNPNGGPVPLSPEPFSVELDFLPGTFAAGDLAGALATLEAAADPFALLDQGFIVYQGPLGDDFQDDIFFEVDGLTVTSKVPEPVLLGLLGIAGLAFAGRRNR